MNRDMHIPRDTPLKRAIYACDERVGFGGACVKVRPSKKIADLPVEDHIAFLIETLKPIAVEIGL